MINTGPILAIDIGGTKFAAGVLDDSGRIVAAARTRTPRGIDLAAEQLWRDLTALLDRVTTRAGITASDLAGVGIGCGGPMKWPAGVVSPLNIPAWRDFPLRERLALRYPGRPVRLHNDAVCVAIGEHWRGSGRGRSNMLGMVVSTGVGAGLILGGRLVDGVSGNAGHIGHVVVEPEGPPCECGGRGCLEAIARGPALAAWAWAQGWRAGSVEATAKDLADDAARGHEIALRAMRRAGRAIGIALASAAALCDLEVVAIGGGLSQAGPMLFDPLQETYRIHGRLEFIRDLSIVPVALGQEAGVVGAAALVAAGDQYWSGD